LDITAGSPDPSGLAIAGMLLERSGKANAFLKGQWIGGATVASNKDRPQVLDADQVRLNE